MILKYHPAAARELLAAVRYYEAHRAGLGGEFLDEYDAALKEIAKYPGRSPVARGLARRYRLHRFPYAIVYETRAKFLVVVAVMHGKQSPEYWINRLSS